MSQNLAQKLWQLQSFCAEQIGMSMCFFHKGQSLAMGKVTYLFAQRFLLKLSSLLKLLKLYTAYENFAVAAQTTIKFLYNLNT